MYFFIASVNDGSFPDLVCIYLLSLQILYFSTTVLTFLESGSKLVLGH